MANELCRLDKKTLYKQVGEELREYIIRNGLKAGDRLPTEHELAARLGVSRNSIREGIRYLETLGFIETCIKVGITIKADNLAPLSDMLNFQYRRLNISLQELHEARLLMEENAVELALTRISAEQLTTMEQAIERSILKNTRDEDITEEDFLFHKTILAATGNKIIEQFTEVLASIFLEHVQNPHRQPDHQIAQAKGEQTVLEHRRILDAIRSRDIAAARAAVRLHLSVYLPVNSAAEI